MSRKACLAIALILAVRWALGSEDGNAQALYAIKVIQREGQPIPLESVARALRGELGAKLIPNVTGDRAGLIVFTPSTTMSQQTFVDRLRRIVRKHKDIMQLLPVLSKAGSYAVPTGKIIIEFNEEVTLARARSTLVSLDLKVVQEPTALRARRVVVEPGRQAADADPISLAKKIAADPLVRFAEADLLNVFLAPRPRPK
jgi:hypothetical protein